jgi:two-component system, OmpR family, response regulator MprA
MTDTAILLVEDDRDIRETLIEALEQEGYAVTGAFDGIDALEKLRAAGAAPDIVLLDVMMPRMDGVQFAAEMRKTPAWKDIPIVLVTADVNGKTTAQQVGAAAFLKKPIKLASLFDTVRATLGGVTGTTAPR